MGQYDKLAQIYDYLVMGVDYEAWADYLEEVLRKYNFPVRQVADLACGTGNTSLPLARRGYQVTGIDLAPAMIDLARQKAEKEGLSIDFLVQDMRKLALQEPVDLITCYHDGLNYLVEAGDLPATFAQVKAHLVPGGFFIFDFVAVKKLDSAGSGTTFVDEENLSLVWDSFYDGSKDLWQITLTGFIRKGDLYEKFQETHQEKAYSQEEITTFLINAGFEFLGAYHSFSFEPPNDKTRRIFYIARREV